LVDEFLNVPSPHALEPKRPPNCSTHSRSPIGLSGRCSSTLDELSGGRAVTVEATGG